ncbi:glycosyltransferase [Rhodoferax sp. UBA5149]|uniref:glycosyltransferase n=1 Tax=Rhodoferax sp. UBA5149 TaxID=1947379 RepID=UPI0025EC9415|nr:glycosyltransferase [Rhodoferax sp. UBA5149]
MDGRAASHTITDKLPHLRRAGIEVVVLSGVSGTHDPLVEHHQLWPMGPAGFRFELRHVLRRRLGSGIRYRLAMLLASIFLLPWMLIEKFLRPVESSWSWWLSAYLKGRQLARQKPFDLIYSTGGAFAAHLAARSLKQATGTPWLAEVHDPMVVPGEVPVTRRQKMQAEVEHLICTHADIAIWFTEQALASARQRHPQLAERGKMMLPGIDKPFAVLPPYQPGQKFVIGHFGSLSPTRHLGPIVAALELLSVRRPDLVEATELHVYGGPLDRISSDLLVGSRVHQCTRQFGRIEADPITGLSGREQILHRMRSVDVLLLLHGEDVICSEYFPSKLYEYLWMQRPILAVVHRNPQMAALIRGQGHAVVLSDEDGTGSSAVSSALAAALEQLFDRWRTKGLEDNGQSSPFTTEAAVAQLIAWSEQCSPAR